MNGQELERVVYDRPLQEAEWLSMWKYSYGEWGDHSWRGRLAYRWARLRYWLRRHLAKVG